MRRYRRSDSRVGMRGERPRRDTIMDRERASLASKHGGGMHCPWGILTPTMSVAPSKQRSPPELTGSDEMRRIMRLQTT